MDVKKILDAIRDMAVVMMAMGGLCCLTSVEQSESWTQTVMLILASAVLFFAAVLVAKGSDRSRSENFDNEELW